ncbi:MAG: PepSY domain-containing protein [Burkholderiales bacterium]|nr:PepSY domain-containing protein [Burkholderiales bacterium]
MKSRIGIMLALALALAPAAVIADGGSERAWRALKAGEILPLTRILEVVHRDFAGDVIEVELERSDGRWIYEIKLLSTKGAVIELDYDARDARLLRTKGSGVGAARRSNR